jgi:hypothetical protein
MELLISNFTHLRLANRSRLARTRPELERLRAEAVLDPESESYVRDVGQALRE